MDLQINASYVSSEIMRLIINTMFSVSRSTRRLFALVIGVDIYADPKYNLEGAVRDADDFEKFLGDMPASDHVIVKLRNGEAKRAKILESLEALANEKSHKPDDCVVIYYAGHGTEGNAPREWQDSTSPTRRIQLLCPHDFTFPEDKSSECDTLGIPDLTIAYWLNRILATRKNTVSISQVHR